MCPCFTYITTTKHKVTFMKRNVPDLKVHVDHQTIVGTCGQKDERKNKVATVTFGGNVCMQVCVGVSREAGSKKQEILRSCRGDTPSNQTRR